jgi:hypothetical protein
VCCQPEVGEGGIPRAGDFAERGEDEFLDSAEDDIEEHRGEEAEYDIVREPGDRNEDSRSHGGGGCNRLMDWED